MASSDHSPDPRIAAADEALGRRDPSAARALLEAAAASGEVGVDVWRKLASMRRSTGDLQGAHAALRQALLYDPLDFIALLALAGLLDQQEDPRAGEVYGQALAQRPAGQLPPSVERALHRGEGVYRAFQRAGEVHFLAAAYDSGAALDPDAQNRFERFASNSARRTRPFHSEPTHFHYPGLREREFHPRDEFPWLAAWEGAASTIAAEFERMVANESAELVPYVQYADQAPLSQWRALNNSRDWTAVHLIQRGRTIEANARSCPITMEALSLIPQPWIPGCGANAMFSLLAPRTMIPPHSGVANFRLVAHLPLIVPSGCWFRVGAETREWQKGEAFIFDDTIEHEAANPSDQPRVVMIIDCWHPDLDPAERTAIAAALRGSEAAEF